MKNGSFKEKVTHLNSLIESGETVRAIELYYHDAVSMQENEEPPRLGKTVNLAQEKKNVAAVKSANCTLLRQVIDEEQALVFSEWKLVFTYPNEETYQITEVALQEWKDGLVFKEKFYYQKSFQLK
jgi:hypothetical protein